MDKAFEYQTLGWEIRANLSNLNVYEKILLYPALM